MLSKFLQFILLTSLVNVTTHGNHYFFREGSDLNKNSANIPNNILNHKIDLSKKSNSLNIDNKSNNNTNDKKTIDKRRSNIENNNSSGTTKLTYLRDMKNIWNNTLQYSDFTINSTRSAKEQALKNIQSNNEINNSVSNNIQNSISISNNNTNQNINKRQRAASKKALENIILYSKQNNFFETEYEKHDIQVTNNNTKKRSNLGNRGKTKQSNIKKESKNMKKVLNKNNLKITNYYGNLQNLVKNGTILDISEVKLQYHNLYRELLKNNKNNIRPLNEENKITNNINNNQNINDNNNHNALMQINNNNDIHNESQINDNSNIKLKLPVFVHDNQINNSKDNKETIISNMNFSKPNTIQNNCIYQIQNDDNNHNKSKNNKTILNSTPIVTTLNTVSNNNNQYQNNNTIWKPLITTPIKSKLNTSPYNNNLSEYWNQKSKNNIDCSRIDSKNLYSDFSNCDNKFKTPIKIDKTTFNDFKNSINNSSAIINDRYYKLQINQKTFNEDNSNLANNNSNNINIKRDLLQEFKNVESDNNFTFLNSVNNLTIDNNYINISPVKNINHTGTDVGNNDYNNTINNIDNNITPKLLRIKAVNNNSTNYKTNVQNNNIELNKGNNSSVKKNLYNDFSLESNNNINKTAENIDQQDNK